MNTSGNFESNNINKNELKIKANRKDAEVVVRALQQVFGLLGLHEKLKDVLVLYVNGTAHDALGDTYRNLKAHRDETPNGKMLLVAMESEEKLRNTCGFSDLLDLPYVKYISAIEVIPMVVAVEFDEKDESDEKVKSLENMVSIQSKEKVLAVLQHDLKDYVINGRDGEYKENFQRLVGKARELFAIADTIPDMEVADFIRNSKTRFDKNLEVRDIEGVFCDVDDTLLYRDGTANQRVVEMLITKLTEGYDVTIWTGGDLEEANAKVKKIPELRDFDVVSKHDYAGVRAEIVIDNESQEELFYKNWIQAKEFIRM